jgi:hypothetical protein
VGPLERIARAGQDRVDRAAADPGTEQFLAQLDAIPARDAVSHRQRRDRGPQPQPGRAPADPGGQLPGLLAPAHGAAHAHALMLDHPNRQPGQLLDLMASRSSGRDPLVLAKDMPAPTRRRPVLDDLVHDRGRQQLPAPALVTGLGPCERPDERFERRPGPGLGGSLDGGAELFLEFLASSRSNFSTRPVNARIWPSIRNKTSTTTSRPAPKTASASARSTPPNSTPPSYVPPPN